MKHAKLMDKWRNMEKIDRYKNGITAITQNLTRDEHKPENPGFHLVGVNAIVGNNGAGKSSFFEFLTNPNYSKIPFYNHEVLLENGKLLEIPNQRLDALIIDPFAELKQSNVELGNFRSAIDSEGTYFAEAKELELINYVLSSSYSEVGFTEVEISEEQACPYFKVKTGTDFYDNETLSQGEQLVLYIFWALRIKNKYSPLVFLEEPEAGLSPSTQTKLLEMIVSISSDDKKQIIVSTHSPFIVQNLGRSRVILLKKEEKSVWYRIRNEEYLEELGMTLGKTHLYIVEDHKAKIFLERILDIYGSQMRHKADILFVGGESNVYEIMSRLDSTNIELSVTGVLDGDIKEIDKFKGLVEKGCCLFLPGTKAPEVEIIDCIAANQQEYAIRLGVSPRRLSDCIRRLEGIDHHDYFAELSKALFDEVKLSVYEAAFKIWFENFESREEVEAFAKKVDEHLDEEDFKEANNAYPLNL